MTDLPPKTDTETASLAAATAAAVTGPQTPDNVKVSRPAHSAVWSLFAGMAVICIFGLAIIVVLTWPRIAGWSASEAIDKERIHFLGWMGLIAVGTLPLFAFAIASPWVGRVEASAGNNHVILDGRQG